MSQKLKGINSSKTIFVCNFPHSGIQENVVCCCLAVAEAIVRMTSSRGGSAAACSLIIIFAHAAQSKHIINIHSMLKKAKFLH